MGLHQIKNLSAQQRKKNQQNEKATNKMGKKKIFANHISDKGLKSKICKFIYISFLFRVHEAYGSLQARGWFRAAAASLRHSQSNMGSEPSLWSTPQLRPTQDP